MYTVKRNKVILNIKNGLMILTAILIIFTLFLSHEAKASTDDPEKDKTILYIIAGYYYPVDDDRNIKTYNLDIYYLIDELESEYLSLYAGLTATYAYGDITQLEGELSNGTLKEVNYDNDAFGVGPGMMAAFRVIDYAGLSLHIDAAGNLIFYSERFPAGGDIYNFMWRVGPGLRYTISENHGIGVRYKWMHVSNGQGMESKNPSYEALGIELEYSFVF